MIDEFLEPSDEEVLGGSAGTSSPEDNYEDNEEEGSAVDGAGAGKSKGLGVRRGSDSDASAPADEDEDNGGWGTSKRDYYNADVIETEADALEEEAEAIRLQKKHLQGLTEADFGFDEAEWLEFGKGGGQDDQGDENRVISEILPQLEITDSMGPEEKTRVLTTRYPEFQPLAKEFLELQDTHEELRLAAVALKSVEAHLSHDSDKHASDEIPLNVASIAPLKYSALSGYLAALSMYLAIFSSNVEIEDGKAQSINPVELRDHPIMETLMQCRDLWGKVRDVQIPEPAELAINNKQDSGDTNVLEELPLNGVKGSQSTEKVDKARPKKTKKNAAQRAAEIAQVEADKRRAERIQQTEENLKHLSTLKSISSRRSKLARVPDLQKDFEDGDDSEFGDATTLTTYEAAEKAKRKKTLRFYTSQITQKANRRDNAGRDAGGDADIPHRERLRDRQARLNAEAESRGRKKKELKGEALGGDSDEEDHKAAKEIRADDNEEDYYDLVATRSKQKKSDKAALAAAQQQAAKEGGLVHAVEEVGADGKRAITYAIEKNKGLAPKRKKDVRNPRVKKRKKYEDKKKKLSSIRQVYKGGEGRGGYGGELTGIKKGLIRSVKL